MKCMWIPSLGGDGPKYEIVCADDDLESSRNDSQQEPSNYQRARVLCSYDAKDQSELNLIANEVRSLYTHVFGVEFNL